MSGLSCVSKHPFANAWKNYIRRSTRKRTCGVLYAFSFSILQCDHLDLCVIYINMPEYTVPHEAPQRYYFHAFAIGFACYIAFRRTPNSCFPPQSRIFWGQRRPASFWHSISFVILRLVELLASSLNSFAQVYSWPNQSSAAFQHTWSLDCAQTGRFLCFREVWRRICFCNWVWARKAWFY